MVWVNDVVIGLVFFVIDVKILVCVVIMGVGMLIMDFENGDMIDGVVLVMGDCILIKN